MTEHTFGLNRTEDQRSHERFWCRCWVRQFSKHYQVQTEVEFTKEDPPDCFFYDYSQEWYCEKELG